MIRQTDRKKGLDPSPDKQHDFSNPFSFSTLNMPTLAA
jgi:hypothetical protein